VGNRDAAADARAHDALTLFEVLDHAHAVGHDLGPDESVHQRLDHGILSGGREVEDHTRLVEDFREQTRSPGKRGPNRGPPEGGRRRQCP
jgi:hypothetical protein